MALGKATMAMGTAIAIMRTITTTMEMEKTMETTTTTTITTIMGTTTTKTIQITRSWNHQKRDRNELSAKRRGHASPKPFSVHLSVRRGSPRITRR